MQNGPPPPTKIDRRAAANTITLAQGSNLNLEISSVPTKAKPSEPAYSQTLNDNSEKAVFWVKNLWRARGEVLASSSDRSDIYRNTGESVSKDTTQLWRVLWKQFANLSDAVAEGRKSIRVVGWCFRVKHVTSWVASLTYNLPSIDDHKGPTLSNWFLRKYK